MILGNDITGLEKGFALHIINFTKGDIRGLLHGEGLILHQEIAESLNIFRAGTSSQRGHPLAMIFKSIYKLLPLGNNNIRSQQK